MVMQIQVQIGDTRRVFFCESAWECLGFKKYYIFAWDSEDTFYGFWNTLRKRERRICSVEWRSHGRHSPRFACLLALFLLARIACLLHICVKTSRFHYSIWDTPKLKGFVLFQISSLIVASWVIRARWREIRRFVVKFKASYFFLNSYIWCFLVEKINLRVQRKNTLHLECKEVRDQFLENLGFAIHFQSVIRSIKITKIVLRLALIESLT